MMMKRKLERARGRGVTFVSTTTTSFAHFFSFFSF